MRKLQTVQPNGLWLVTVAAMIWGTIGVATQIIYKIDSTTSLFINLARMLIATPVLLAACWRVIGQAMFHIRRRDFVIMALAGAFLAISQAAYFAAIRHTGVTIATLLTLCITPLVITGLSVLLKLEVLTGRIVVALVCAVVGTVLLIGLQPSDDTAYNVPLGALFALIAAVSYASMILCGRFVASDYHPLQITAVTFVAGTLVLVPLNVFSGVVVAHTMQGWLLILYLGLVPSALAYWLFQTGLRSVSATAASIISLLEPTVAAFLAWGLFGERLAATGIAGAGLLLFSIFLLSADKKS